MRVDESRAIDRWVTAGEPRRKRGADVVGLLPLYEAGDPGVTATARSWYGFGFLATGRASVLDDVYYALMPTGRDVLAEAMPDEPAAVARNAFGRGLVTLHASGPAIPVVANLWASAPGKNRAAAAFIVAGMLDPDETEGEAIAAKVFYRLGTASGSMENARAVFAQALTDDNPRLPSHLEVHGQCVALHFRAQTLTAEVIPAPRGGFIVGRDGRRYRVRDMAALADRINAQAVRPRVDVDHQSERTSPTFRGSSEASGWLSNFRVGASGGIEADFDLREGAIRAIRDGGYRYLSPALVHTKDGEVFGLSSVALVNDPNFELRAPGA